MECKKIICYDNLKFNSLAWGTSCTLLFLSALLQVAKACHFGSIERRESPLSVQRSKFRGSKWLIRFFCVKPSSQHQGYLPVLKGLFLLQEHLAGCKAQQPHWNVCWGCSRALLLSQELLDYCRIDFGGFFSQELPFISLGKFSFTRFVSFLPLQMDIIVLTDG